MTRSPDQQEITELRQAHPGLNGRLERLPPGHPSSPREADGSRKPPVPSPYPDGPPPEGAATGPARDSPTRTLPPDARPPAFSDAHWADHVRLVSERLEQARADGQATDERFTVEPDREVWAKERRAVHTTIVEGIFQQAARVPNDRHAIIAGGLPGAGKTSVLEHHAGIDRSQFLAVNPDDVKVELARRGLLPQVPGLSPMETSDLAHEESSHVAKRLARRALAEGKNVIWDITMSSLASTEARIRDLRASGYTQIDGVFVDLPPEVSARRSDGRHRDGEEKYRAGDGEGGRFIPGEVIMANTDPAWGSVNRKTFEAVKAALDAWAVYDNSVDGRDPVLVDSSQQERKS